MRISNSFSEGEIQVLDFILSTMLRGGSPAMATRNRDFASLCRKVVSMKQRVEETKRKAVLSNRKVPDVSSVGAIDAPDDIEVDDSAIEDVG
ncbi:MAG: hypothetical protein H6719_02090 [Sandaracinaceae bacterium]|nr:hypothetical protein [Sandaracinaceae bacterium]